MEAPPLNLPCYPLIVVIFRNWLFAVHVCVYMSQSSSRCAAWSFTPSSSLRASTFASTTSSTGATAWPGEGLSSHLVGGFSTASTPRATKITISSDWRWTLFRGVCSRANSKRLCYWGNTVHWTSAWNCISIMRKRTPRMVSRVFLVYAPTPFLPC